MCMLCVHTLESSQRCQEVNQDPFSWKKEGKKFQVPEISKFEKWPFYGVCLKMMALPLLPRMANFKDRYATIPEVLSWNGEKSEVILLPVLGGLVGPGPSFGASGSATGGGGGVFGCLYSQSYNTLKLCSEASE